MATLALAGDVMLGRGVDEALRGMPPQGPWGDFLPLLREQDARIVNLECSLTRSRTRWRYPKTFHFGADPTAVEVLRAARIDAVSLANNHTLDFEVEGLLETVRTLDAGGIAHAGAGATLAEAQRPCLIAAGDEVVGLVALTDNEPEFAAESDRPGTSYLPVSLDAATLEIVQEQVRSVKEAGATTVVLANHWGPNMVERPPERFRRFARAAIDLGVDVYFGHSAHLVQGVEVYRNRLILYDTGDFIDDYAVDPFLRNDRSFLFLVRLHEGRPVALELVPARLSFARVDQARGEEAQAIRERMIALCGQLGTRTATAGERLVIALSD